MRRAATVARRTLLMAAAAAPASAQRLTAEVWRDPQCGCCGGWVEHLRAEGFAVTDRVVPSVAPFRRMLGTPAELLSCHAGRIAGIALEGHVPAFAIRAALREGPARIAGVAVPAMPVGTPGMEVPGREAEPYDVIAWRPDGTQFALLRMRGAAPA
ncbi:DUF411 domain-containing protein [Roseococcus sp. SDR]|uniref:DUF411 domain-containing protein n=1 Tax=Roseococcus sp. SDR TaxID=2835532 RepID=UPI001BD0FE1F|nr:DUF411 domain-containing protein [Roseococcus sp. SDR]MBS7789357.1 DUF411 domain-containing protein [Roseococcus sp. SDR]MBV1844671.1 DUF411 domain-containing protein [Roseococcus sp. SDR]